MEVAGSSGLAGPDFFPTDHAFDSFWVAVPPFCQLFGCYPNATYYRRSAAMGNYWVLVTDGLF
jgi:hypothetical protein